MTIFDRDGHYVFIFPAYCGTECPEGYKIKGTRMPEQDYAAALPAISCAVSQGYRSLDRDCGTRPCEEDGHMVFTVKRDTLEVEKGGQSRCFPHDGSAFDIERAMAEAMRADSPKTHEIKVSF
ncbi:MAG: hypothetical protein JJT96_07915 [Opitutales bacterium]|nr:hypothetical protein [Opitutales bacterium]